MIARALLATITNAVSAINKGVFFMTTSLLRALSIKAAFTASATALVSTWNRRLWSSLRSLLP